MLLQTKFLPPPYDDKCVPRQRLLAALTSRPTRKMLLVSAPAGFGKTTLIQQCLHSSQRSSCWLSLDHNDNDICRFWRYIVGAIANTIEDFGGEANALIDQHEIDAAITAIINELAAWSLAGNALSIVLDDFHVIDQADTLRSFAYFVDFLPPNIELLITTRFEPALPISRWSVKNWVDSLYASDLVFSFDEAKAFFTDYMALALSEQQISDIHERTEGWIAAMQLSALSASGSRGQEQAKLPPSRLLNDDKHFIDYVIYEILEHQSDELKRFMLDSAAVSKMNARLLDDMRSQHNSHELLQQLQAKNLFIIALDKDKDWFRYHEIFRDALLTRCKQLDPERLNDLQRKAVQWLIAHKLPHEAIEQAILLKDWSLLSELLVENGNNLIHEGFHLPMLDWLAHLKERRVAASPRLLMLKIWALFFSNKIAVIAPYLNDLEALIDKQRIENVSTSPDELIDLHNEISLIRSYLARSQSDLRSAHELTRQVLEALDHTNMPLKSVTYYGLGLDSFTVGDLSSAQDALVAAIEHGKREKKYTTVLSSSGLLGWIYFYQGQLQQALETCIHSQQWIDSYQDSSQPRVISCWQNTGLAMTYIQRGEYTIAQSYINPLLKHIEQGTEPGLHILIQYTQARYLFAQQGYVEAIECLEDAQAVYEHKKDAVVFTPPSLAAMKARCLIAINQVDKAYSTLQMLDTEAIMAIPLNYEDINLTKARVYILRNELEVAAEMAKLIVAQTREKNHTFHLVQALILLGLALLKLGKQERAQACIDESLSIASRESLIAVYAGELPEIQKLLSLADTSAIADSYLQKLSQALGLQQASQTSSKLPGARAFESNLQLLEPLSQRELEVLGLIDQGLANKEIAFKLSLAPATVKAHIRNLYGKIGAKSRTEALSKARQLKLLQND